VEYLENSPPWCVAVGSSMMITPRSGILRKLTHPYLITKDQLVKNWPCVAHPTVMFRSHVFQDIGVYDETIDYCEDYDLWFRIIEHYGEWSIHNLPDILYTKNEHDLTNTAKGKKNGLISLYNEMVLLKAKIRSKKNEL